VGTPGRGSGKKVRRVKAECCNRPLIELPTDLQSMGALELLQRGRAVGTPHSVRLARISPVLFQALLYRHDAGLA
jgi:hypothetical protein